MKNGDAKNLRTTSGRYLSDGSPAVHQEFCCVGGEGHSDGKDEDLGRNSTSTAIEDWLIIWVQTKA